LQNKAIKIIGGGTWLESAIPYYSKLKILKLQDLYQLELATFMFKFKIKQLPSNFINYLIQSTKNNSHKKYKIFTI